MFDISCKQRRLGIFPVWLLWLYPLENNKTIKSFYYRPTHIITYHHSFHEILLAFFYFLLIKQHITWSFLWVNLCFNIHHLFLWKVPISHIHLQQPLQFFQNFTISESWLNWKYYSIFDYGITTWISRAIWGIFNSRKPS